MPAASSRNFAGSLDSPRVQALASSPRRSPLDASATPDTELGPDHPDTLTTLNNLAVAYRSAGRLPEAIALFERVRDGRIAKLGPDHPDTLTTLNNLAAAYWKTKQLDKSVPLFEDVLKRQEAKLGRQHPRYADDGGQPRGQLQGCRPAQGGDPTPRRSPSSGESFPTLRWVASPLIDAYAKAGENAKLADLLQEQLPEARKTLPKDSPQLAGLLAQIGLSLLAQKKWTEAEPLLRECLAIREKSAARPLVHLQHAVDARRRLAGPEEIRRSRTALAEGLRGDEAAGEDDPAAGQHPHPRGPRPAHRSLHRDEQAGRSQEVAGRAGEVSGGRPAAGEEVKTSQPLKGIVNNWPVVRFVTRGFDLVQSPRADSGTAGSRLLQTHQRMMLCRGRELALNHDDSRKFL